MKQNKMLWITIGILAIVNIALIAKPKPVKVLEVRELYIVDESGKRRIHFAATEKYGASIVMPTHFNHTGIMLRAGQGIAEIVVTDAQGNKRSMR